LCSPSQDVEIDIAPDETATFPKIKGFNVMKLLTSIFAGLALAVIARAADPAPTGPIIGNVPQKVEYKDGVLHTTGFPPGTEIKDAYTERIGIVQEDGTVKEQPADNKAPKVGSESPQLSLSISFEGYEQFNINKYNARPLTFSVRNIGNKAVIVHDIGSNRGIRLYILSDDKKMTEIFPFDARRGGKEGEAMENRRTARLEAGERWRDTIQIPIPLIAEMASRSVIASITVNYPNEYQSTCETFSEPFSFPKVEK
jgi:hypothetical protein